MRLNNRIDDVPDGDLGCNATEITGINKGLKEVATYRTNHLLLISPYTSPKMLERSSVNAGK